MKLKSIIAVLTGASMTFSVMGVLSVSEDLSYGLSAHASSSVMSIEEGVEYLRDEFVKRSSPIVLTVENPGGTVYDTFVSLYDMSLEETDVPEEGDYLRWSFSSVGYKASYTSSKITYTITPSYRTNASQEAVVDDFVDEFMSEYILSSMSDYEKISAIYEYAADNISYTSGTFTDIDYTAYGAVANGNSVCLGYSMLTYRLLRESGISSRIIAGTAGGGLHAWVIAEIDELYYNLDPTWDAGYSSYSYFMKGAKDFDQEGSVYTHTRNIEETDDTYGSMDYDSEEFHTLYPMSLFAYDPSITDCDAGDLNCSGKADAIDASTVLSSYAYNATGKGYGLNASQLSAADVNGDSIVNAVDASDILSYYAYTATGGTLDIISFLQQ